MVKLTYKLITHNIVRCYLDKSATVDVGSASSTQVTRYRCRSWNMSAVIVCRATISTEAGSAVIEWRDEGPVKVSGDLEIEISKRIEQ